MLDEQGKPIGEDFNVVDDDVGGYPGRPAVAVRPSDGSYLVTWHQYAVGTEGIPVSINGRRPRR